MRREDGFTLPEVLIACVIGFIVLSAALGLLESTVRLGGGTMAKTDAMQRGRLAMDVVTRQLRSQVCGVAGEPAIVEGDDDKITFYADFGDGGRAPDLRTLALDDNTLVASVHTGSGPPPGPYTFPSTPSRTEHVLENVVPQAGKPFLSYFPVSTEAVPEPAAFATPLSASDRHRVARIEIAYSARPTRAGDGKHAIGLNDQVTVRHADVNHSEPDPFCP